VVRFRGFIALLAVAFIVVVSGGCSVLYIHTRGTETETKIKTQTTGYLLILPLWISDTEITKTSEK
jgi:hypothetical protein